MKTSTPFRLFLCAATLLIFPLLVRGAEETDNSATPSKRVPAVAGPSVGRNYFDETYQFIFFATLEGLYRDGASDADVNALLVRKDAKTGCLNFIYSCPICMPVEGAVETYKLRPHVDYLKLVNHQTEERTFGFGLPNETSIALRSEKASVRLGAVNELVSKWVSYRMEHSGFTEEQKKELLEKLKKGREEGMKSLQGFARDANGPGSIKNFAPGYQTGDECAICNAALQMPLKLKAPER